MIKKEAKLFVHLLEIAFLEGLATKEEIELGKKLAEKWDIKINLSHT